MIEKATEEQNGKKKHRGARKEKLSRTMRVSAL
jgi:hypothetical protein